MEAEIRPEPDRSEREALLVALRDELGAHASPYSSAWRAAAGDRDEDYEAGGRPRSNRGASRA